MQPSYRCTQTRRELTGEPGLVAMRFRMFDMQPTNTKFNKDCYNISRSHLVQGRSKKIRKGRQVHIRIGTSLELGSFSTPALKIFVEVPNGATRLKVNPGQTKIAHFF